MELSGKNALVTGARKGIGRAIVEQFAQSGANIWACASKQDDRFELDMRQLAHRYGCWIEPVYFDLSDESSVKEALAPLVRGASPVDILVNNAGIPYGASMHMTPTKDLRRVLEINFIAQILVTQLVSRKMMRQRSGSIVNMGSIGGIEGREGYLAYGSSKAAILWATKCISKELAPYNIRVNAVAPGLVDTSMGSFKPTEESEKILASICMKRLGTPSEIAQAVSFLASDRSSFITGSVLTVDGGRII